VGDCSGSSVIYNDYSIPFEIENDVNEGKICFYATDEAGNLEEGINEEFYEIDVSAPDSYALSLSTYTTSKTFDVAYTTTNATDLDYVELYYSHEG